MLFFTIKHRHTVKSLLSPETASKSNRVGSSFHRIRTRAAAALIPVIVAASTHAQSISQSSVAPTTVAVTPTADSWGVALPNWLPAPSVTVKEGYDSSIYGVSDNLAGHPNIANVSSWFTTLSANITFDLLAASGGQNGGVLRTLTLAYAGDYTQYDAAAREDNLRNTFTLEVAGNSGPWSFSIDNPLLYVDGSKEDVFFNYYNNLGFAVDRERRNQIQERNTSFLRYDASAWFVRAVDSATYFNLLIDEHNPVGAYKGYANWINRDDVNGGLDLGYKLTPDFSFITGWRIGQQTQAQLYYNPVASDSTYNRALFGFEGKPLKWLQSQFVAGPDFRRYSDASHPGLLGKRHTWFYLQGQLTATFTPQDTLTASAKVWHFVSSTGVASIQETAESLIYKHAFSSKLSTSAGVRVLGHRYDAPTVRDDWTTNIPVNATYALTSNLSVSADYSATSGHSRFPVAVSPGQNFEDNIVSLSLKASF
jgi:hypothetical protein